MVVPNATASLQAPEARHSAVADAIQASQGRNDSLPVELLEVIFLYAFAGAQDAQPVRPERRRRIRLPFRLAAVCRLWRCVALYNTPLIWSDIVVDMCAFKSAVRQAGYVELLLERSKAFPLDISVYYVRDGVPRASRSVFEVYVFRRLRELVPRWRTLRMNVPAECLDSKRLKMFALETPLLEELCVDFNFRKGCRSPALSRMRFGEPRCLPFCPRLRTLVVHNTGFFDLWPFRWLPLAPLAVEELDVVSSGLDPYEQLRLLNIAPALTTLRFCNFRMFAPGTAPHGGPLDYPHLRHLTIPSMAPRLLAAWAPGLADLHGLDTLDVTGHAYDELWSVLHSLQPTVTRLSFTLEDGDVCPEDDSALFHELARLSRLRELRIECPAARPPLVWFRALCEGARAPLQLFRALRDGARAMWPELRVVQLRGADLRSDEQAGIGHGRTTGAGPAAQALLDFVVSRNAPRARRKEEALGRAPRARLDLVVLLGCQIDPAILDGMRLHVPVEERPRDSPWVSETRATGSRSRSSH